MDLDLAHLRRMEQARVCSLHSATVSPSEHRETHQIDLGAGEEYGDGMKRANTSEQVSVAHFSSKPF